jgi:hypothetical protein
MMRILSIILFFAVSTGSVLADGKVFYREKIPLMIPYQRALLIYDGGRETLLIQSRFQSQQSKPVPSVGWVVPVPAVPELASMDAYVADRLFFVLRLASRPKVIDLTIIAYFFVFSVTAIIAVIGFLPLRSMRLGWVRENRRRVFRFCLVALFFELLSFSIFVPSLSKSSGIADSVELVKAERVGIYDVKVIRSKNSADLITWLKGNNFQYTQTDAQVFDDYIKRGWCFVVANVRASEEEKQEQKESHIKDFDAWLEKKLVEDKNILDALGRK